MARDNTDGTLLRGGSEYKQCLARAQAARQGHIFRWWDQLDAAGREKLLRQTASVDFQLVSDLAARHLGAGPEKFSGTIGLARVIPLPRTEEQFAERRRMAALGADAIARGEVALFIVAGGQGSRLKFDPPKGTFPICPITDKSLFHLFAEKLTATSRRCGVTIPLYIMTSTINNAATVEFFEINEYFGLGRENVMFVVQGMLPTLDASGKLILKRKDELFLSPNGHGGSITALKQGGALADMRRRGIRHISYHQVDNALVNSIDPVFIGYHVAAGAEMSLKVAQKRDAEEGLGVVGNVDGKLTVIEYSDLAPELMHTRRPDGSLLYGAGNIAIHILDVNFVERLNQAGSGLPWHVATKAVPFIDDSGKLVKPDKPNGIKFEMFVFDALPQAQAAVILESEREEEFAPVKNKHGQDSAATAKQALTNCYGRWLKQAGVEVPFDGEGNVDGKIEISPLFALDPEELAAKVSPDLKFTGELLLE
ncbi:MAG: UDPGP type 1 family protein [Planctomycetes bacterium]|nr:UDPGP type 1 family protein [Planctomycetota bacterium]